MSMPEQDTITDLDYEEALDKVVEITDELIIVARESGVMDEAEQIVKDAFTYNQAWRVNR